MAYKQTPYDIEDGGTGASTAAGARTSLGVPATTAVMLLDGSQAMTADMPLGGFKITNLGTPTAGTDAANKSYVDSVSSGVDWKGSCRVATTGSNITLAGGAPDTLDGVSLAANDRILVKDQTTASQNGIYYVATLGTGSDGTWSRALDADTSAEVTAGLASFIEEGTLYADTGWILVTNNPITLGTTSLTFTQFTSLGQITAGAGLTKTGNTLDVGAGTGITVNADDIQISATYPGQTSIITVGTITTGTWDATDIAVTAGGTGASTASGARANLAAAPNTVNYWIGTASGELTNGLVPSGGTGILVTSTTGVIAVDTAVVATTTNTLTMSNKTLTAPILNQPRIRRAVAQKTATYTLTATDDFVKFTVTSGAVAQLPSSAGLTTGQFFTVKNSFSSTANVTLQTDGSDLLEGSAATTKTVKKGDSYDCIWDGVEFVLI